MKIKKFHYGSLLLCGFLLATSCVDNNYDLSDIDTTSAVKLDGLTIPVNLSEITLNQVLDIDKESDGIVAVYTDAAGKEYYAIKQDGSFNADPVKIDELRLVDNVSVPSFTMPAINGNATSLSVDFSYLIKNVDPSLLYLTYFGLKEGYYMQIDLDINPAPVSVSGLKIKIPETYVAVYNNQTFNDGIIPVEIVNGSLQYPIYVTKMEFNPSIPNIDNVLNIGGKIGIESGSINSGGNDLTFQFKMSPFTVNVVSGGINYEVEAPSINPVELNDLPDFLTSGETNLVLQNPQLYLNFASLYGANYNTGLTISPEGAGTKDTYIKMDPFKTSIALAPDVDDLGLPDLLKSPVLQKAPQLQYVLSGNGLPEKLNITLDNPYLDGDVEMITLGTEPGIELSGSYTFFTPLSFASDSKIIYMKKEQDFFGDDIKKVEVTELQVTTDVTTNLPFEVNLTVYALDKDGNRIENASASTKVPVNAQGYLLDLHFDKPFTGLNGVEIVVTADQMNGDTLTPDQFIKLENIRATITGELVAKF